MNSYYNTNKETGEVLKKSNRKATNQEDLILTYFRCVKYPKELSPDYFINMVCFENTPITSIRRALTNLTKKGYLEKTDKMVTGQYGKKVHTWKLKKRSQTVNIKKI